MLTTDDGMSSGEVNVLFDLLLGVCSIYEVQRVTTSLGRFSVSIRVSRRLI